MAKVTKQLENLRGLLSVNGLSRPSAIKIFCTSCNCKKCIQRTFAQKRRVQLRNAILLTAQILLVEYGSWKRAHFRKSAPTLNLHKLFHINLNEKRSKTVWGSIFMQ